MTLLRNTRWFFAAWAVGVLAMVLMVANPSPGEASTTRDAVALATDSSPPALLAMESGAVGARAPQMSTLEGAVLGFSSIWLLPIALVGVGVLARPLLSGSGNWHLWRSSPAEQKGNNWRARAGMKPKAPRGLPGT